MLTRIVFIHGNQTIHWSLSWAGWLKKELDKAGYPNFFETFPDSITARSEYWLPFLKDHSQAGEVDGIVGWSSGGVASLRYAEDNKIKGSVIISANYTDLGDAFEKQSGFYEKPWNWQAIKNNQEKIALFYGDDDPYIPQSQFEYISSQLHPTVFKIHEGKHFIEYETFPQLLEYLKKTYPK